MPLTRETAEGTGGHRRPPRRDSTARPRRAISRRTTTALRGQPCRTAPPASATLEQVVAHLRQWPDLTPESRAGGRLRKRAAVLAASRLVPGVELVHVGRGLASCHWFASAELEQPLPDMLTDAYALQGKRTPVLYVVHVEHGPTFAPESNGAFHVEERPDISSWHAPGHSSAYLVRPRFLPETYRRRHKSLRHNCWWQAHVGYFAARPGLVPAVPLRWDGDTEGGDARDDLRRAVVAEDERLRPLTSR